MRQGKSIRALPRRSPRPAPGREPDPGRSLCPPKCVTSEHGVQPATHPQLREEVTAQSTAGTGPQASRLRLRGAPPPVPPAGTPLCRAQARHRGRCPLRTPVCLWSLGPGQGPPCPPDGGATLVVLTPVPGEESRPPVDADGGRRGGGVSGEEAPGGPSVRTGVLGGQSRPDRPPGWVGSARSSLGPCPQESGRPCGDVCRHSTRAAPGPQRGPPCDSAQRRCGTQAFRLPA